MTLLPADDRLLPLPRPDAAMTPDPTAGAKARLLALFDELFAHDGFGALRVEMRILRRGQKEVILDCGKQYRFVLDHENGHGRAGRRAEHALPGDVGSPANATKNRAHGPNVARASGAEVALTQTQSGDLT